MTGEEAKQALLTGAPVVWEHPMYGRIVYAEIRAIRYHKEKSRIAVSLEMYDKNRNSINTAPMKEVIMHKE